MRNDIAALLVAIALGAVFGFHTISDPDLHQQIAVGRALLADPSSIGTSTFTYTFPGYRYVEDKWLASVLVACVEGFGGIDGLMAYQIALAALAAVAWFALLRVWGCPPWGALAGSSVLLVAGAFRLEPRPDTLSHAFLAIALALLGSKLPMRRAAPALVALMLVWVNVHGYFLNGLLVIAAAALAAALGDPRGPLAAPPRRTAIARGAGLLGAAVLACVAHPQGVAAATWPIRQIVLLREQPALRKALTEFAPTLDLLVGLGPGHAMVLLAAPAVGIALALMRAGADPRIRVAAGAALGAFWLAVPPPGAAPWPYRVTFALAIAAAVEAPRAIRERRLLPVLAFAGFSILAVPMVRNLSLVPPAAAIVVAPAWAEALRVGARTRGRRRLAVAVAALLVAIAAWGRLADHLAPGTYRAPGWTGWGLARDRFPEAAADAIADGTLPAEILNNYDTSGYLLHRMHPARAAFIVDNTSMFPPAFLDEYRSRIMAGRTDPEELHGRFGVRTVVLDHAAMETPGLVGRLARSKSFRLVRLDRAAAVWVRDGSAGEAPSFGPTVDLDEAASRWATHPPDRPFLPSWLLPRRRVFPALNVAIFLRAVGRPDLALREVDRLWDAGSAVELATFAAAASEDAGRLADVVPRLEEVRAISRGATVLESWLARALYVRGVERMERGDIAAARSDLIRALDLSPDSGGPSYALARLEASVGDFPEARRRLEAAFASADGERMRGAAATDPRLAPLLSPASPSPR